MDNINPSYYQFSNDLQVIDVMKSVLSDSEYRGYLKGQILKYTYRFKQKNGEEDLSKALWYKAKLDEV